MPPWLSVLMPTYNGQRWIAEALQSVAAEHDDGIECVVVDGGSNDSTLAIVEKFASCLRLRVLIRPDLPRWVEKTNFAFEVAAADHVCMLHNDDFWLPGRAREVKTALSSAPDGALILHDTRFVDAESRSLGTWRCALPCRTPSDDMIARLLVQNFIAVPSPTFRRVDALRVGRIDPELWYTGDWDLYLKLASVGPTVYLNKTLAAFRVHEGSLTVSGSRDAREFGAQLDAVLERHASRISPQHHRNEVLRLARASNRVNTALAAAMHGRLGSLPGAALSIARLGPRAWWRFFRETRLHERIAARLFASARGNIATIGLGWRRH